MAKNRSFDFDQAFTALEKGDFALLEKCLRLNPELAAERDTSNATLLIRLIDHPGHRLNAAAMARLLIRSGAEVDARRDASNGTALTGVISTNDVDTARVLLDAGADLNAPCGFCDGTAYELALDSKDKELIQLVKMYR
jgi:ankyrin repeat protein